MHRFELAPNCAMTAKATAGFFLSIATVSLTIAIGLAALGYWPILPFAGLELGGLGAALWWTRHRARDREYIEISADTVLIERHRHRQAGTEIAERVRLPRPWTRVRLQGGRTASDPSRLMLGSHGRWCRVGEFLPPDERIGLSRRLRDVLREPAEN
jgi:uncharacterized membrane protein